MLTATAAMVAAGTGVALSQADHAPADPAPADPSHSVPGPSAEMLANPRLTDPFTIKTKGPSDAFIIRATFPPGTDGGWHAHAGPGFFVVVKGTATLYEGDDPYCRPRRISAGTGVVEPGHTHLVRNEGTEPLEIYSIPIVPAGDESADEVPNPGHCPF